METLFVYFCQMFVNIVFSLCFVFVGSGEILVSVLFYNGGSLASCDLCPYLVDE